MDARESAETVALRALAWLAARDDLLPLFLDASGTDLADLRTRAGDADFLASVVEFVLSDDAWVIAFAQENGLPFEALSRARAGLPGGQLPNWT
jgi:hypothetical protein